MADRPQPSVGLLGLGNMGAVLAERLLTAGQVVAFDPDEARCRSAVDIGIELATSVADVADRTSTVVLSLPSPRISRDAVEVLLSSWGERAGNGLVIETSTVTPDDVHHCHAACAAVGASFVDAAILSGVTPVATGTSLLLVGGDPAAVAAAGPVLDAMCPHQRRMGGPGSGMAAKVINNAVAHAVYVVLAEAVAMGRATGVPLGTLVDLLADPEGGLMRPLTHRIAQRLAVRDFGGGMSTASARKDSVLALEMARANGVPLFAMQAAHTVYDLALAAGMGPDDYSIVATLWDQWSEEKQ